jgi:putative transposase
MARPLRMDAPGCLHHVIVRGNEQRPIFRDDSDRKRYLDMLAIRRSRLEFRLLAYCLMTDHAHFAIRTGPIPLARVMQSLQTAYAQAFNRRHSRVGHLFQGRYKAFLVEDERYFLTLLRYIHFNPVAVRMCKRPEQHPWSSASAFLENRGPDWLDLDEAFRLVAHRPSEARRVYRALMGKDPGVEPYSRTATAEDADYVVRILKPGDPSLTRELDVRRVADALGHALGLSARDFRARSRGASRFRAAVAYLAREEGEIPIAKTALFFGRSESAVSHGVRVLESALDQEPELRRTLRGVRAIVRRAAPAKRPVATASPFRGVRLRD